MLRIIKALLVLLIGLHALFYALQNIANLSQAHAALSYVMSNADHESYPSTLFFAITSPLASWTAVLVVLAGEFAVGYFGIKGGWDLFMARGASAEAFHEAKRSGVIATGIALLVWFGLFMTFGAAFFEMWQTEVGSGAMQGSFMYATASAITMLLVCVTPD